MSFKTRSRSRVVRLQTLSDLWAEHRKAIEAKIDQNGGWPKDISSLQRGSDTDGQLVMEVWDSGFADGVRAALLDLTVFWFEVKPKPVVIEIYTGQPADLGSIILVFAKDPAEAEQKIREAGVP